jgi:hypothetical protein
MAWETRNGKGRYYTRSKWVAGKVVRQYFRCGEEAEGAAAEDLARRRAARERRKQQVEDIMLEAEWDVLLSRRWDLFRRMMAAAGYHRPNRGKWRKKRIPRGRRKAPQRRTVSSAPIAERAPAAASPAPDPTSPVWPPAPRPAHRSTVRPCARPFRRIRPRRPAAAAPAPSPDAPCPKPQAPGPEPFTATEWCGFKNLTRVSRRSPVGLAGESPASAAAQRPSS